MNRDPWRSIRQDCCHPFPNWTGCPGSSHCDCSILCRKTGANTSLKTRISAFRKIAHGSAGLCRMPGSARSRIRPVAFAGTPRRRWCIRRVRRQPVHSEGNGCGKNDRYICRLPRIDSTGADCSSIARRAPKARLASGSRSRAAVIADRKLSEMTSCAPHHMKYSDEEASRQKLKFLAAPIFCGWRTYTNRSSCAANDSHNSRLPSSDALSEIRTLKSAWS